MFRAKSDLFEQINAVGKKKWSKECAEILSQLIIQQSEDNRDEPIDKGHAVQNVVNASLNRMRERIGALEDLSDQLYYCTCFLIENLPELILKTIYSDFTANHILDHVNVSLQPNAIWESCHPKINDKPLPSRREKDVLELLAKGYCVKEIARQLYISETTVITHKKNLKKKFNVKNMVELISKISRIT